ncbi:hypothetical protein [Loktanella sp. S4079]|uniref:hypothetical protein n=1 Tax=Loktanella sp. S4079 TaxID=579483 RepID=UPI0005F9FB5E|nr:hypothetical protein [Loktanella sp. S4079]KJZ19887.1 hypothetical protein TW80_03150 [Loktanella sp. S4079]
MNAKNLIIHIGHRNADASLLQNTLFASQSILEQQRIYFPAFASKNEAGYALGSCYEAPDEPSHWDLIKEDIAKRRFENVIVSNPSFLRDLTVQSAQRFEAQTNNIADQKTVVAYLRPPGAHFLSLIQQRLRQAKELAPPSRTRVKERIQPLSQVWSGKISLRVFDEQNLSHGNIVDDFFLREVPQARTSQLSRTNPLAKPPLSTEAMALLIDRMHGRLDERLDPASLVKQIIRLDAMLPDPTQPTLHASVLQTLNNWAAPDLAWLREKQGIKFQEVKYRQIDADDVDMGLIHFIDMAQIAPVNADRKHALYKRARRLARLPRRVQDWIAAR